MNFQKNNKTFIIKTLGCKVNQYESEMMRHNLLRSGFQESDSRELADLYILNSCTVTHKADRDARRLIRHFHGLNPEAKIIVAGCYAETVKDRELLSQIPGVAYLLRNKEKEMVGETLMPNYKPQTTNYKLQVTSFKNRDRAFVKIQDGCNHRCSYCKVALVRGMSISRDKEEILEEVRQLMEAGYKEIVVTGVCLGAWGRDFKIPLSLTHLLRHISDLTGNFRLRLSSIEPIYISDELIDLIKTSPKFCKHFHIPLESGDDKILRVMDRGYTTNDFFRLVTKIRKKIPNFALTTDVMIGFHGEDNNSFKKTYGFVKRIAPSRMHIFSYSKRFGTPAYKIGDIPCEKEVKKRISSLKLLADSLSRRYASKFKNKIVSVLVESKRDKRTELLTGYTDTYVKVLIDGQDSLMNNIIPAKILKVNKSGNFARPG